MPYFDSYQIYYKTDTGGSYAYYDSSSSSTPSLSSLIPNTDYYIRLVPYSNTSGLYGSPIDASTTTIGKITGFNTIDSGQTDISLSWTGYYKYVNVYYGTTSETYTANKFAYGSSVNISNLTKNTTYYFNVVPYNNLSISGDFYGEINTMTSASLSSSWTPNYSDLKVYYKFDDTSYNSIIDTIGSYNTTASEGCILGTNGAVNKCINMNSAGYIPLSQSVLNNLTSYTITCWVYINSYGSYIITSKQGDSTGTYAVLSIGCYANGGGNLINDVAGYVYYHPQNGQTIASSSVPISTGEWNYIAVTCTNSTCKIYINGSLSSTTTTNCTLPNNTSMTNSYIGRFVNQGVQSGALINGYLDDFALFSVELSATNIATIYNYQSGAYTTYSISSTSTAYSFLTGTSYKTAIQFKYDTGTSSTSYTFTPSKDVSCSLLLIAGGGGGGSQGGGWSEGGGGGGAGGLGYGTVYLKSGTSYTIAVGKGGSGSNGDTIGTNGSDSTFSGSSGTTYISETAYGGGVGGTRNNNYNTSYSSSTSVENSGSGYTGGSGSGSIGGYASTGTTTITSNYIKKVGSPTKGVSYSYSGMTNMLYMGCSGGNGGWTCGGGGGGGAGGIGVTTVRTSSQTTTLGGAGGAGFYYTFTQTTYASGGAGGSNQDITTSTSATTGGGGAGGIPSTSGTTNYGGNATSHTGGGGGGGGGGSISSRGGSGGSGTIILLFN